jgi:hypothetical protein
VRERLLIQSVLDHPTINESELGGIDSKLIELELDRYHVLDDYHDPDELHEFELERDVIVEQQRTLLGSHAPVHGPERVACRGAWGRIARHRCGGAARCSPDLRGSDMPQGEPQPREAPLAAHKRAEVASRTPEFMAP